METPKRKYKKHKTEVKITVKHFLNTELKPDVDKRTGLSLYPLYVRINVNRQLTKFKSRLNNFVPANELDMLLNHPTHKKYIDNERLIIEETIKELKPDDKADFKLKAWSNYYERGLIPISDGINDILMSRIEKLLSETYKWENEMIVKLEKNAAVTLRILAKLNVPEAQEMYDRYCILFNASTYESVIKNTAQTAYKFCLWDWFYGFYQTIIKEILPNKAPEFIERLDELLSFYKK